MEKPSVLLGFLLFWTYPEKPVGALHHFGEFHHFAAKFGLNSEKALER